jgi:hypothetical protein
VRPPGPRPLAVEPGWGWPDKATAVAIRGESFLVAPRANLDDEARASVDQRFRAWLGSRELGSVSFESVRLLRAQVPAGLAPGLYDLLLVDPRGAEGRLPAAFRVGGPVDAGADAPRIDAGDDGPRADSLRVDGMADSPRSDRPQPELDAPKPDSAKPDLRPPDLRPPDLRPPDLRPPDLRPPDLRPPDLRPPDTGSPCVSDHFLAATGWKVTAIKGSWSWFSPTYLRHQLSGYNVAEAQIQGSAAMLAGSKVGGTASLTLRAVYNNGNSHGAGLALLIQSNGSPSTADRLVACVARQSSSTSSNSGAGIWYFNGSSNGASSLASGSSFGVSILDKPAAVTMTVTKSGSTWTMSCTVDADGKQSSGSATITSYVTAAPFGIALVSFGTSVDFDSFSLCP